MWSVRCLYPRACWLRHAANPICHPSTITASIRTEHTAQQVHTSNVLLAVRARKSKKHLIRKSGEKKQYLKEKEVVEVWKGMTVKEFAALVDRKPKDLLGAVDLLQENPKLFDCEFPRRVNDAIEEPAVIRGFAELTGHRIKYKPPAETEKEDKDEYPLKSRPDAVMQRRPPIVAIMGHVDHGKTTLLDSLRHSNVVAREFGGITQHMGAFSVKVPGGEGTGCITFLDTPGHAAFSSMRARGAKSTDIVVLVVAADDGVMRQTEESLKYALDAGDPIIVAINKIDKPAADIEGTKRELLTLGLELEEYGGDTQVVCVSALKQTGLDELQEAILAQAELLQLQSDTKGSCEGLVIEASTDAGGRGKLATVILQHGTLKRGMWLVAGRSYARVKTMRDDSGRNISLAQPAIPVEVSGWRELPEAGDVVLQVATEHRAHEVMKYRAHKAHEAQTVAAQADIEQKQHEHQVEYQHLRDENQAAGKRWRSIYNRIKSKEVVQTYFGPELSVIIKADVTGSLEAILDMIAMYRDERCKLGAIGHDVGPVSLADVELAAPFSGIIYAFNVKVDPAIMELAHSKGVTIRQTNIIYNLYEDLKLELNHRLPKGHEDETIGEANVIAHITIKEGKKKVPIVGCQCTKGHLQKDARFRLKRDDEVLFDGAIVSLKHLKNEVGSVKTGVECGLRLEDTSIIPQPMDTIECYQVKDIEQEIEWELDT